MTAVIRYKDESIYYGQVNSNMVPNGKGVWHSHEKVVKGTWIDGVYDDINFNEKNTVDGFQTYSTKIEPFWDPRNKPREALLTANFVNGIADGFGTYSTGASVYEAMFVRGQPYGRRKRTYTLSGCIINRYSYAYTNGLDIESVTSTDSRHALTLKSKFMEYKHVICPNSRRLESEEVIHPNITAYSISFENIRFMHRCGISSGDDTEMNISRYIYRNGDIKYVFNTQPNLKYKYDGTVEVIANIFQY